MESNTNIFMFPTKNYCEILFFQSKQEMLKSAAEYPDVIIPILGGGSDTELDEMFPNVYCALRKNVDGVGDVSNLGENIKSRSDKIMSDLEYRVFLEETSDTLGKLTECCKETGELLKVIELKLKIAEQLHRCSQS